MEEKLSQIIEQIVNACRTNDLRPSDDIVLDCATRILNSNNIQISKIDTFNLATEKQKNTLEGLGVNVTNPGLTKLEASKIISELLEKKRKDKEYVQPETEINEVEF